MTFGIDCSEIASAEEPFREAISRIRPPENPPLIRRLPDGRAIARISKVVGRPAHQPAVSFGNWRWAI